MSVNGGKRYKLGIFHDGLGLAQTSRAKQEQDSRPAVMADIPDHVRVAAV